MNLTQVIEEIKKRQETNIATNKAFKALVKVLQGFEGKEITKRIETALLKEGEWQISFHRPENTFEQFKLFVWGGETGLKYEERIYAYLGRKTNPYFSMEWFIKENPGYTSIDVQIAKTNEELANMDNLIKIEQIANEIKEKQNLFDQMIENLPHRYVLQNLLK